MKAAAFFIAALFVSCTLDSVMPDELTIGHGRGESSYGGVIDTGHNPWPTEMDGDSESTYAALTWSLPSFVDDTQSWEERDHHRSSILEQEEAEVMESSETGITGATYKADGRHAAAFGGIIALLLVFLLIKLKRSNGWH